jgi:hypothetical protein
MANSDFNQLSNCSNAFPQHFIDLFQAVKEDNIEYVNSFLSSNEENKLSK